MLSPKSILSPNDKTRFSQQSTATGTSYRSSKRFRESTHLIPSPGEFQNARLFNTIFLSLPLITIVPLVMVAMGIGLEVAIRISDKNQGFEVPAQNVFSLLSQQFLLSFVPTLIVVPIAFMWRELDFHVRWYQPYVVLAKGNATAEESLLLDYLYEGIVPSMYHAMKWKHWVVYFSALSAALTFTFQPLAAGIFSIQQMVKTEDTTVTGLRQVGLPNDIGDLNAFSAAAGFVEAAVVNDLSDPPFVVDGWATARFAIPAWQGFNGTLVVNTTAINTDPHCATPKTDPTIQEDGSNITITATSVDDCTVSVYLDETAAQQQYGVVPTNCANVATTPVDQQPVMFWYYHQRDDNQQLEARTVFCAPAIEAFEVSGRASLNNNSITSCERTGDYDKGLPINGPPFNAVVFQNNTNPFIQARALAVNSGVPGAIFRFASQQPNGPQSTFDLPNGFLDLTLQVYTQHLALAATSIYFVNQNSTLPAQVTSFMPRLVLNPLASHFLAIFLIAVGIIGFVVQFLNRRQRSRVRLGAPPGSIATIVALTSRSGFGEMLLPYDNEDDLRRKLKGLRFRLDRRTGAIVAEDADEGAQENGGRDSAMMRLLGKSGPGGMGYGGRGADSQSRGEYENLMDRNRKSPVVVTFEDVDRPSSGSNSGSNSGPTSNTGHDTRDSRPDSDTTLVPGHGGPYRTPYDPM